MSFDESNIISFAEKERDISEKQKMKSLIL